MPDVLKCMIIASKSLEISQDVLIPGCKFSMVGKASRVKAETFICKTIGWDYSS